VLTSLDYLKCISGYACLRVTVLARQLHSAVTSAKGRIVIGGIITSIARFLGIEPNSNDRVRGSERFDKVVFELMGFCQVEAGRFCWIYPGG